MKENTFVHLATKILVDVLMVLGGLATLASSLFAKMLRDLGGYDGSVVLPFTAILFCTGVFCVYILYNLRCMFKTLLGGNPFVLQNVVCFRRMAVACAVICAVYIAKCFYICTAASLVIVAIFGIACLFCLTLKDIFKRAVIYKEENDLTI